LTQGKRTRDLRAGRRAADRVVRRIAGEVRAGIEF
jgi:hypothetical protein